MPTISFSELTCAFQSVFAIIICGIALFAFAKSSKEKTERKGIAIFLFIFLILCCVSFWALDARSSPQSPRWKPTAQDIEGTYYPISGSSELLTEIGYTTIPSEYSMTFSADGTFSAINLPDVIWNPNYVHYGYGKAEGTWQFQNDTINGEWDIQLHITKVDDKEMDTYSNVELSGKKPPFIVYFPFGELDWFMYGKR